MPAMAKLNIRRDIHTALKARSRATGIPMNRIIGAMLDKAQAVPKAAPVSGSIHEALLKVVAANPDADTVLAVSHVLRRLPA